MANRPKKAAAAAKQALVADVPVWTVCVRESAVCARACGFRGVDRVGRAEWPRRSRVCAMGVREPKRAGRGEWESGYVWARPGVSEPAGIRPSPPCVIAAQIESVLDVKNRKAVRAAGVFERPENFCVLPPLRPCLR